MKPYFEAPGVTLYCGDCLQLLPTLEAGSVDAVVTDPPYGIGYRYDAGREKTNTPETYWRWLSPRHSEWMRCLKPGGLFFVWQAHKNFRHLWDWFGSDIAVYAACKNFFQILPGPIQFNGYDPVVMGYKTGGKPLLPTVRKRGHNFYVANTANMKLRPKGHPCPRPIGQAVEAVENFTIPGGLCLDPFTGSGTTGVACVQTGRRFIGVELSEPYCEIAARRIEKAIQDAPLFAESPPCK